MLGLSYIQIHQILNIFKQAGELSPTSRQIVIQEKSEIIKKSGILELVNFKEGLNDIGGLEALKEWLKNKAEIFSKLEEAIEYGVDIPKGLLLMGMPGCGKSLSAKVAARLFNLPLLRLDIGRLLGKYVGESEENFRKALSLAESISPVVLWVDEIEKAFAGIDQNGGASDITKRLFGHFLTWLQEKENTVFVVATANDISSFPPEFLRKGRFDEIFYIDFPTDEERESIIKIHLEKRNINTLDLNLSKLSKNSEGFSGADIEAVVKEAIEYSFLNNEEITETKINEMLEKAEPISMVLEDKIKKLRKTLGKYKIKSATDNSTCKTHKNKDLVYVQGSKYTSSFYKNEIKLNSFYISKYLVTQELYTDIIGKNPSPDYCRSPKLPVLTIYWGDALEYCNKLSIRDGYQPVYKLNESSNLSGRSRLEKIIYKNGQEVDLHIADFSKTEGYRLPTELEWEWAAVGGLPAIQNNTLDSKYSGSDELNEVAWYKENSRINGDWRPKDIAKLKPNELGIYDMTGNVNEWVYDSYNYSPNYLDPEKPYYYDSAIDERVIRGGSCDSENYECQLGYRENIRLSSTKTTGIRICKSK